MKTKFGNVFAALAMMGVLASTSLVVVAAQPIDTPEIRAAAQNATTHDEHESIAKYYENTAAQMQAKVAEQKELLEQYENKSYLYGREAQDLQSHTSALIRDYEKSVKASVKAAALHWQMAARLNQNHAANTHSASGL
jgi:predicted ribosome quality control (RQC) complex YloA/Tae2 family protein